MTENDWLWAVIALCVWALLAIIILVGIVTDTPKVEDMVKLTDEQKQECTKCLEDMQEVLKNSLEKYKENSVLSGEINTEYIKQQEKNIQKCGELVHKIKSSDKIDVTTCNYLLMLLTISNTQRK